MNKRRPRRLAAPILAALALAACADRADPPAADGALIRLSDQFTGEFELIDHNGDPYGSSDLEGRTGIVYFGFATCPDVCPMALGVLSAALNELGERELEGLQPIFITVDPERDTPAALKTYLSSFHDAFIGLTGDVESIDAARASFKVYAKKSPLPESALGYTMDHTSFFYLVDREGRPTYAIKDSVGPAELAALLRRRI